MISKSEWQRAFRDSLEDEQQRVGPPPSDEQLEALQRGALSDHEADRVREQLSYYPGLARAMATPFPEDGDAQPPEEAQADQAELRWRVRALPAPPVAFPHRRTLTPVLSAAAAIIVIVAIAGTVAWLTTRGEARRTVTRVLYADGHRGAGAQTPIQLSTAIDYVLKPVFRPTRSYREYRLDLVQADTTPPRIVWSHSGMHRESDGSYPVMIYTKDLAPGRYELALFGVDASESDRLSSYTVRVFAP